MSRKLSAADFDGAAGGGGGVVEIEGYAGIPAIQMSPGTVFDAGFFGGRAIVMEEDGTIDAVAVMLNAASATTKVIPAVYAVNDNGTVGDLLAQGPQVTGVVAGLNEWPLASPLTVPAGTRVYIGVQVTVAGMTCATVAGHGTLFFTSTGALPNPAPGATYNAGTSMSFFAKVTRAASGGGGGSVTITGTEGREPFFLGSAGVFSGGNQGGVMLIADRDMTITDVRFFATAASATAVLTPAIYAGSSAGVAGALLAQGAPVTGAVAGQNILPLNAPLQVSKGDIIFATVQILTGNVSIAANGGNGYFYFASTGALPTDMTGKALSNAGFSFYVGTEYVVSGGGGGGGGGDTGWAETTPLLADFPIDLNNTGMDYSDASYGIRMYQAANAAFAARGKFRAAPAAPWNIYAKFDLSLVEHGNNCRLGIGVRNSVSGKVMLAGFYTFPTGAEERTLEMWTGSTYNGRAISQYPFGERAKWVRLENDGTNLKLYHGDGEEWILTGTVTLASFIGSIDEVGIAHQINNPSIFKVLSWSFDPPA